MRAWEGKRGGGIVKRSYEVRDERDKMLPRHLYTTSDLLLKDISEF